MGIPLSNEQIEKVAEERVHKDVEKGVQIIQYQVITLMTTNGQAPFISIAMYLNEAGDNQQLRDDLAMIIKEVLRQRYQGVKNEQGVYITPAFPKLLYFLEKDNAHPGTKYWDVTEAAIRCSLHRMVPDYISEKIMLQNKIDKNGNGNAYPCMGCVAGDEVIAYRMNGNLYVESFSRMWARMSHQFDVKSQPGRLDDKYIDLVGVEIYDNVNGWTDCFRIIRNNASQLMRITFSDGRILDCTPDHPFETENRGVVPAEMLEDTDKIRIDTTCKWDMERKSTREEAMAAFVDFHQLPETNLCIPNEVFSMCREDRLRFVTCLIRGFDCVMNNTPTNTSISILTLNKMFATQTALLIQTLDMTAVVKPASWRDANDEKQSAYAVTFNLTKELADIVASSIKYEVMQSEPEASAIVSPECVQFIEGVHPSYDVTTASDHFTVSGIYSHNCRSFLTPYIDPETGKGKYYGRFNQGVVTVNLPFVAMASEKNMDEFWREFDETLELCHRALRIRHERLLGTPSDVAPILWQYGALARLKKGEVIDKLLYGGYSTLSLGYAGLYEAVYYLTGHSHTEPEGEPLATAIMQRMNDKCNEWKTAENIDYSLYGTPLESTTYKFAKALKQHFGVVENVSSHNYVTNSYHVCVREKINAFDKLKFESKFQKLSPGGAISYVEIPNMENNVEAAEAIVEYIYDNIMYAELNSKSDYCQCCGYSGEIQIVEDDGKLVWECPNCGNRDQHKMNVARRTCGYIGTQYWNQGRTAEIRDRVTHIDCEMETE